LNGDFFRRSLELNLEVQTRNDWEFRAGWEGGRFLNEHDRQFTVGITRNDSNRFDRVGVRYNFGQAASRPIRFVQPFVSRRLFGRWDFSLSAGILRHLDNQELYVLTFAREFSPTRAIGGRVLIRNGELDYFVSYRVSGGRGMETYILLGDPVGNGRKTKTRLMTKVVFPVSF
jgi:hypothetical protein